MLLGKEVTMKRGFTLLEVLSVIVILGILSTLLAPKIIDFVDSTEEKTALDSARQYVKAVDKYLVENNFDKAGTYNVATSNEDMEPFNNLIEISGKLPTGNTITIDDQYSVTEAILVFGHYQVTYNGNDYSVSELEE